MSQSQLRRGVFPFIAEPSWSEKIIICCINIIGTCRITHNVFFAGEVIKVPVENSTANTRSHSVKGRSRPEEISPKGNKDLYSE